jgi:hypothetical protein
MVATENIQCRFLTEVKKGLHPSLSLADELAEILNISRDSAYRRIRGETTMALDEIKVICSRYRVSVDSLITPSSSLVSFYHRAVGFDGFTFHDWLRSIDEQLTAMRRSPGGRIDCLAKDIPVFYFFGYPLLAAYKMYFWLKTHLATDFQNTRFSMDCIPREYLSLAAKIHSKYNGLNSTEVWNEESSIATLREVEYHFACGAFSSVDDALAVLDGYQEMMDQIRVSARNGVKGAGSGELKLYKNELMLGDNTLYLRLGTGQATLLQHGPFEWLSTSHEGYCNETEKRIANSLSRSVEISITGERECNVFFNKIAVRIEQAKERIRMAALNLND